MNRHLPRRAFSLLELMIAMTILSLGLIMVATMFPVAWSRARDLSEQTVQQTAAGAAQAAVRSLVRPSGLEVIEPFNLSTKKCEGDPKLRLNSGSLAGDLFYDPILGQTSNCVPIPSDTNVHALNLENLPVAGNLPVPEDPWRQELIPWLLEPNKGWCGDLSFVLDLGCGFGQNSFYSAQITLAQRMFPPLPVWSGSASDYERLDRRRFCWAVFHRLRAGVGPQVGTPAGPKFISMAEEGIRSARRLDVYYVTLRRPQPTSRYAMQDPGLAFIPDPRNLTGAPLVAPQAQPPAADVMLPVPWRVQVQFTTVPSTLATAATATGIPTEIEIPPPNYPSNNVAAQRMLVQMFPVGAQFIDEISGRVYRVVQRRITGAEGEKAFLTLDREVLFEDLDLPAGYPWCMGGCISGTPPLDPQELLRTVWVFPPPAEPRQSASQKYPLFEGRPPVVGIDVRTLVVSPISQ
ncbi:MAG: prepilin-type N-terminal cleavage/methylation domain-containing protein [Planctomycetes bacterium]|nr:prepilin-type N-terminal cleavage/methylation domain-containing protein [Planctomycetota bacterium]